MTCEQWNEEFRKWLDQDWSDRATLQCPSSVRRHAEGCPRCAPRLRAALLLVEGAALEKQPPAGLAERIAARLRTRTPVRPRLRPLWIGIPAVALLVVGLGIGLLIPRQSRGAGQTIVVRFELWDPEAQKLEDRDGDGIWEIEIPLTPGEEHQYQFLIDGRTWIPDPKAPLQVEDGFGGINSVLQI